MHVVCGKTVSLTLVNGTEGKLSGEAILADRDGSAADNRFSGKRAAKDNGNIGIKLSHNGAYISFNSNVGVFTGDGHAITVFIVTLHFAGAALGFNKCQPVNAFNACEVLDA